MTEGHFFINFVSKKIYFIVNVGTTNAKIFSPADFPEKKRPSVKIAQKRRFWLKIAIFG